MGPLSCVLKPGLGPRLGDTGERTQQKCLALGLTLTRCPPGSPGAPLSPPSSSQGPNPSHKRGDSCLGQTLTLCPPWLPGAPPFSSILQAGAPSHPQVPPPEKCPPAWVSHLSPCASFVPSHSRPNTVHTDPRDSHRSWATLLHGSPLLHLPGAPLEPVHPLLSPPHGLHQ